ncbi:MAG TPA: integrase core domain-containing protein, partial [Trueperaceae bacterium]
MPEHLAAADQESAGGQRQRTPHHPPGTPKANGKVERMQRTFRDEHYAYEPPHLDLEGANTHLRSY